MISANQIQQTFEEYLQNLDYSHNPDNLYAPIRYVLSLGGKRIRPTLLVLAYNMYAEDVKSVYDVAVGMEVFHNFTLLHDDVMDNAEMRRGSLTVHKKWNENTAILSGDGMFVLAYQYLAKCNPIYLKQVLDLANDTFIGITDGQQFDMDFETRSDVSESEYIEMIRLKTSILLAACLKMGALLGGASEQDASLLYSFGEKLGLAFQLQDDLLDVYGDAKVFGKRIGGDIVCNKKTYMYINTCLLASEEEKGVLAKWAQYEGDDVDAKIEAVKAVYDSVGIKGKAEAKIEELFNEAMSLLNKVSVSEDRKNVLREYALGLMNRVL
ncbi:MAG: polyprenyl synthetase family protein [Bacteroidaceae bacterium]|nr:polyprenyl synthetase family protein [Bacteroidaceae bacterium]MBR4302331.1 polyprenyl synthetase family protein [Bacteroidaceae bacterium]